ncbi:hypothetical protein B0H14DRAFT_3902447 [Mycena olivaceomarginata]|nr:hypothetical protein B0H14DRAFT_3902447 [Mycena olivaceomarginata]
MSTTSARRGGFEREAAARCHSGTLFQVFRAQVVSVHVVASAYQRNIQDCSICRHIRQPETFTTPYPLVYPLVRLALWSLYGFRATTMTIGMKVAPDVSSSLTLPSFSFTSSAAPNASSSSRTPRANPMTLRSATPSSASHPHPLPPPFLFACHVRGLSPAPGRLDEINMGLVVESSASESAPTSPKLSPNLGAAPKLGLTTALGGMQGSPLSSPLDVAGTGARGGVGRGVGAMGAGAGEKEKEGAKRDEDVEMGQEEQHQEGDAASPSTTQSSTLAAPTVPNTNARSPTPSPTLAHTAPASLSSSPAPPLSHT